MRSTPVPTNSRCTRFRRATGGWRLAAWGNSEQIAWRDTDEGNRENHATGRCRAAAIRARRPLVFGVVKKFGDDNTGDLVTNLAYSAFLCVFPLLLILITVLNIVLVNYPSVRHSLLNSTLGKIPCRIRDHLESSTSTGSHRRFEQ